MTAHNFDPTILRAYDIRGQVGSTLSANDAFAIGNIFASFLPKKGAVPRIAVGRDGRLTSPELADALCNGLVAAGCHVIDIGVGPTPMLYFADRILSCDGFTSDNSRRFDTWGSRRFICLYRVNQIIDCSVEYSWFEFNNKWVCNPGSL